MNKSWHEKGELPPVGEKCLCWFDDGRECWHECIVIGSITAERDNGYLAVSLIGSHERKLLWADKFRPLKTERERFVEAAVKLNKAHQWTAAEFAAAMYDAGFKAPEVVE